MVHQRKTTQIKRHCPSERPDGDILNKIFTLAVIKVFRELEEDVEKDKKVLYEQKEYVKSRKPKKKLERVEKYKTEMTN
jgi:hypothetical protein